MKASASEGSLSSDGANSRTASRSINEVIRAPTVTAGLLAPFRGDRIVAEEKRCQLDRLYQCISDNLDALLRAVGLKIAA